ncbi:MAG: ATP-binding protein [Oscillospiraceae bacterium]|nr:ATP-binding protein [Oscillospiraceae bacterium]
MIFGKTKKKKPVKIRRDARASSAVILDKPASKITKKEKKTLFQRLSELKRANKIKNTVQNTIPYQAIFRDGVCQNSENFFSMTVQFFDANYSIAEFDEQNNIFSKYCDIINMFDSTIKFQLTFENQNRSMDKLIKAVQIPSQADSFNDIRKEYSDMLTDKLVKGTNGQSARKFLTFGIESTSHKAAYSKLMSIANDVIKGFKAFNVDAKVLDGTERLETLYYSLNPHTDRPFIFDWDGMLRAGMDTKDFISPSSLKFNKQNFEIGDSFGAVWGMNILAGELPDEVLKSFLELQELFCVNIHVDPLDQVNALKFVKKKLTNVEQMKIDEQKKASQNGYDTDILPPAIKMYIDDISQLLAGLNSKNERLFHISISIRSYAKSKDDLKLHQEMIKRICQKCNSNIFPYDYRQEQCLISTLPLCHDEIPVSREMHTSGVAIFVPFTTKELFQTGVATYYGINTLSGNMIRADRTKLKNPNGLILGTPGSGKSFTVKREILDCFLTTTDDIIICDPEGEYYPLVSALNGQRIRIASNSEHHINPMDIAVNDYLFENPMEVIAEKSGFIISLCELIVGSRYGLTGEERSVIDMCVKKIYSDFVQNEPSKENMPILSDLQNALNEQGEVAQRVSNSLEMFVNGSQNLFNHRTNIDMTNRIICFDIKELGSQLKKVGMLIVQDTVWNRVSLNRELHKYTRYYIDEFHLLLKDQQTSQYSAEIWKRFRKWGGVPTGITQNVKDLLSSAEIENIFDNSDFICMLNQAAGDRDILAEKLHISSEQIKYVENSGPGEGLISYGNTMLPFTDHFPTNTKMFKLMTTRLSDEI